MHDNVTLAQLLEACAPIGDLQAAFNDYQTACFTQRPPEFFALELTGEAGELANLEKKAWKGRVIGPDRFADEAADVLIALMNYSNARGVDLRGAVQAKLREIERRRVSE